NWITVRGFSRQVAAVDRFLETLQKPPGEAVLEVEIWELNVQRAQELGILPPQPFLLQFIGQAAASLGPSLLTFGQGRALFGVRLPGASGSLNFSSSVVRSHQTLQLRASQGQPASLLLGERFPVITSTLSSGITSESDSSSQATLGFFPTIQYQDIGVTLKATPYFHADRELTLQLDVAVRNLGARNPNDLPTITNRQFTEQVRLKDGESYLIGGIRSHSEQTSRTGYPWLSRLPLVGILFSVFKKQRQETELWFLLRPHILRLAPAEEFASPAIFFGKEISGVPAVVETVPMVPPPGVAPPGAPQLPGAPLVPGQPPQPGVAPQPGVPPPAAPSPEEIQPGLTPPQPFPQPAQPEEEAPPL
ncbi:MAG: type II and III secretion system protein, partial [Acidobacteria bacterium]|nr:type II and III secretion system protein [Acidobacteriota bacterium]